MDGLLIVDKPAGPTSHEVVARVRRALGERRIGHTGTLDPAATGVLPLLLGRATRLARFLNSSDKGYEAVIRLGLSTETRDADGRPVGSSYAGMLPARDIIDGALEAFRGTFLQQPPAYSAKKIDGQRSYVLARRRARAAVARATVASGVAPAFGSAGDQRAHEIVDSNQLPAPVSVTARRIDILRYEGSDVTVAVECTAGFYVRSLAHDLGERLGTGAHLLSLRRTKAGRLGLDQAIRLESIEQDHALGLSGLIPLSQMLPDVCAVTLTSDGVRHAAQGRDVGGDDILTGPGAADARWFRLMDPAGDLVAIATSAGLTGLLHPSVVLV